MAKKPEFQSEFHGLMYQYTKSKCYSCFIFSTILVNTTVLIAQTWRVVLVRAEWYFSALDSVFLSIYLMEVVLKLYVWRRSYFHNGRNILNLILVLFNLMDFILPFFMPNVRRFNGGSPFRCLQILRVFNATEDLRTLKNIRMLTNLQIILTTILHSLRSIGIALILITITMYVFGIIGCGVYGSVDSEHFGTLMRALFTLFRLLTLDDWFEIYEYIRSQGRGHVIIYLILYILLEYLIFLNLVVAVMVDTFELSLKESNATTSKEDQVTTDDVDDRSSVSDDSENGSGDVQRQRKKNSLQKYYPDLSDKEKSQLRKYFQISASLDFNYMMLSRQQAVVDMLGDISAENDINLSPNKEYL